MNNTSTTLKENCLVNKRKTTLDGIESFLLILIILFVFFGYSFNFYDTSEACKDRWGDSSYNYKHTRTSGCVVEINNVWVKENSIIWNLKGN